MQLIELLDPTGRSPSIWVNVDHVVSVAPIYRDTGTGVHAEADVKLTSTPPLRMTLGEHTTVEQAEEAFRVFLEGLPRL